MEQARCEIRCAAMLSIAAGKCKCLISELQRVSTNSHPLLNVVSRDVPQVHLATRPPHPASPSPYPHLDDFEYDNVA